MPELLISQDVEKLLDLTLKAQVYGPDGKAKPKKFAEGMRIKRTKQLGSGTQGEVYLSTIVVEG